MNSRETLKIRSGILQTIRQYFLETGAMEVSTPALAPAPGSEPHIEPFSLECRKPDGSAETRYLITSPEHAMKGLLARQSGDIFQICRAFRNEESSRLHRWDFLILEWYRVGETSQKLMEDCERILTQISKVAPAPEDLNLETPFQRHTMNDLFLEHAGVDLERCEESACLMEHAIRAGVDGLEEDEDWETIFYRVFLEKVEPRLPADRPVFITQFPRRLGTTARENADDDRFVDRVELYVGQLELANGWTELTNPADIRARYTEDATKRQASGKSTHPVDEGFFDEIVGGLPECAGMALGLDRLMKLFLGVDSIDETG